MRVTGTAAAGIAAAAARPPVVLICDLGLPDLPGHEVVRAVRRAPGAEGVFAIALTGYAQPEDRARAIEAGFDARLPKPPPLDGLERLLGEAARRRRGG